jgi:hypothetical protein
MRDLEGARVGSCTEAEKKGRGVQGEGVRLGARCGEGRADRALCTWRWRGRCWQDAAEAAAVGRRGQGNGEACVGHMWRMWASQGRREMDWAQKTVPGGGEI